MWNIFYILPFLLGSLAASDMSIIVELVCSSFVHSTDTSFGSVISVFDVKLGVRH